MSLPGPVNRGSYEVDLHELRHQAKVSMSCRGNLTGLMREGGGRISWVWNPRFHRRQAFGIGGLKKSVC